LHVQRPGERGAAEVRPEAHRRRHHRGEVQVMKPLSERNPIVVAIVGLLLLAALALLAFNAANLPIIGGGTGYTAYFAEDAGLAAGNEVRVAGVTVGHVTGISLAGNKVAVTFKVKGTWVGNETTAAIKIKTLLGDKFLALDPLGTRSQDPAPGPADPAVPDPLPLRRDPGVHRVRAAGQPDRYGPARQEPADPGRRVRRHAALRPLGAARARLAVGDRRLPRRAAGRPVARGQERHRG